MNLLFSMPEYQAASRIGVYLSMKTGEIATAPIVHNAISQGKRVFVPYTYRTPSPLPGQPSSVMDMVALLSMEDHGLLKCNIWGIPTPSDDSIIARESCLREPRSEDSTERSSWKGLDLILVPGMAFDTDGRRLGHGKGFYDFFFQQYQESSRLNHAEGTEMPLLGSYGYPSARHSMLTLFYKQSAWRSKSKYFCSPKLFLRKKRTGEWTGYWSGMAGCCESKPRKVRHSSQWMFLAINVMASMLAGAISPQGKSASVGHSVGEAQLVFIRSDSVLGKHCRLSIIFALR